MALYHYIHCMLCVLMCVCENFLSQGLLVARLDGKLAASYPAIFTPLFLTLILLLVSTFARQPANPWWFGLHRTFPTLLLDICPTLQSYTNISIVPEPSDVNQTTVAIETESKLKLKGKQRKEVEEIETIPDDLYPLEDIYTPD